MTRAGPAPARGRLTTEGLAWLAVAVVLGGLGWWKSLNLHLFLAYLMLVLVVLNGVVARLHVRRLEVSREPLPPVYAGEEFVVRITVINLGTRAATVGVTDADVAWHFDRLPPGASAERNERRTFPRRGRVPLESPVVWSAFPFGLLRYERPAGPPDEVIVLPRRGNIDANGLRRWFVRQAGAEGRARKVLRRVTTDHADVRGIRPYRSGDSLRSVHWRSTARRQEMMVREYDAAQAPDLVLVVDPWLPADPSPAERAALEFALSLAATIASEWARTNETRITIVYAGAANELCHAAPVEAAVREASVPLAELSGTPPVAAFDPVVLGRSVTRSARVVVSSRANSPVAGALTQAVGKPFAILDPSTPPAWYQPPSS